MTTSLENSAEGPALPRSVTRLVDGIKAGDELAASELYRRFIERIKGLARRRMTSLSRKMADEQDIANSAMNSLYQGIQNGKFDFNDRDEIWALVATITVRKVAHYHRWLGRHAREESIAESQLGQAFGLASDDFAAECLDELSRILAQLEKEDPLYCRIAELRLSGYTLDEIAGQLGLAERTIKRKLRTIRHLLENGPKE